MSLILFTLSLCIAIAGPALAITYLRPILEKVLVGLCDADGGAEFWIRCCYLLATCGTLLLMLSFGSFGDGVDPVESLRRALWLVFAGVFVSVAIISRNVWAQVRQWLVRKATPDVALSAPATPTVTPTVLEGQTS